MAEQEQDQLTFRMAIGERFYTKSVPAGSARAEVQTILGREFGWIEVDDGGWINRDHVLDVSITPAGEVG